MSLKKEQAKNVKTGMIKLVIIKTFKILISLPLFNELFDSKYEMPRWVCNSVKFT